MKNKTILTNAFKFILVLLISGLISCNGDSFNKYKEAREDDDVPVTPDTAPPGIVAATAIDKNKLSVVFDEEITAETAEVYSNYYIQGNNRVVVVDDPSPVLEDDNRTIILTLSTGHQYGMRHGKEYTLLVQRVSDIYGNAILNETTVFKGLGPVAAEIWHNETRMPDENPFPAFNLKSVEFTVNIYGIESGGYSYSFDGDNFSGVFCTDDPLYLQDLDEGYHSLSVIGYNPETDEWQEADQATYTEFLIDTIPPLAELSRVPMNVTDNPDIAVMVGGDGVETYRYRINNEYWSEEIPVGSAISRTGLSDGNYTLYVHGIDSAGNEQESDTIAEWRLNTDSIVPILTNMPARYTKIRSASFIVSGNNVNYYSYKINNDPWSEFQSVDTHIECNNLSDGEYAISVVGRIKAGDPETEGETVVYIWTVDNVPPVCGISNLPMNPTNTQNTNIIVSSDIGDVVSYKYRLYIGSSAGNLSGTYPASMPIELKSLPENEFTIKVMGIDQAGNIQEESNAAVFTWIVDLTPPNAIIQNMPELITPVTDFEVPVGPPGAVAYKYLLDSGQWSAEIPVSENITGTGLADGYHTLSVVVRDTAGNWQRFSEATEYTWEVDTIPPVVTLSNKPAEVTNIDCVNFYVGGVGVVRYNYRITGINDEWNEHDKVSEPEIKFDDLDTGYYTIEILGVDQAGNWQVMPTTYSWEISNDIPVAMLSGTPADGSSTNNNTVNITVNGPYLAAYKYKLDGYDWSAEHLQTEPVIIGGIPEGPHTIKVIGRNDLYQWQEPANATVLTWTVDTVAPIAELFDTPVSPTNSQNASIRIEGVGVDAYKYSLDIDTDPSDNTLNEIETDGKIINLAGLANGSHTIYVIARDDAGNWQSTPTTHTWEVVTSVPTAEFNPVTLPTNPSNEINISISVGGSGVVKYKYQVDGDPWSGELDTSVQIVKAGLTEGPHTVSALAKNSAGTWQSSPTAYSWSIDISPPSASDITFDSDTLPGNPTSETSVNIDVNGTGIVYYQYKINSESWSSDIDINTNIIRSGLADNDYTLYVIGCDSAGNWTDTGSAKTYSWTVDTVMPVAAITNRPDDPANQDSASFVIAGTGIIEYKYNFDGSGWSGWTDVANPIDMSGLSDASHILLVCGRKSSTPPYFDQEETNATEYTWTVDTLAPTAALSNLPADPATSRSINVDVAGADVVAYRYRIDGGSWIPASTEIIVDFAISVSGLSYDSHTLDVIGRDEAGNWQSVPTSYSWTINPPPLVSPDTSDVGDSSNSSPLRFSWVRPVGTADVKIQVASDGGFASIVFEAIIGNSDYYDFIVTDTEIQSYYARVSVNGSSGMPLNDPSWESWGNPSDGICVTGGGIGTIYAVYAAGGTGTLSGADVELWTDPENDLDPDNDEEPSVFIDSTTTDSNGDFAINSVSIGTNFYRIIASAAGFGNTAKNSVTVVIGNDTNTGILYLVENGAAHGTISGTSVDANDGLRLAGAMVEVYDWENNIVAVDWEDNPVPASFTTDGNGDFTTSDLAPGVYSIRFSLDGYYDLVVDNVIINGNIDMDRQAICAHLVEPQVRVIVLWGYYPRDLDLHLVGSTSKVRTDPDGATNRFHVGYIGGYNYNYNEATGQYEGSNPDRDGTRSTASLVQDDVSGYGPEAINLWRYGGAQYARGTYTYTVRNYSRTNWYQLYNGVATNIIMRVYDSQGMRREIIMPAGANDPNNTTRDWKALKITIQGNSRAQRLIYVPSQDVFFNAGANNSKAGFDW